ncbi:MAG TPA: hypothetical protein VFX61_23680 [Micromonosporaceae bacterium]|nr:hypothetical protein [Micromonosporaceae bacterium]
MNQARDHTFDGDDQFERRGRSWPYRILNSYPRSATGLVGRCRSRSGPYDAIAVVSVRFVQPYHRDVNGETASAALADDGEAAGADQYRAVADRVVLLAERLAHLVDLPTIEQLVDVLVYAGWVAEPRVSRHRFTADGLTAAGRAEPAAVTITVYVADFGCPTDLDYADFDDVVAYDAARDQPYDEAQALVETVAGRLDLEPADPLAVDLRADYGDRVLLRTGHWAVTVAAVQDDSDLPILVEVSFTYGADLPGRLAQLVGPVQHYEPIDWTAVSGQIGADLPDDYRWLMEHYGPGTFDGYLTLIPPAMLSAPVPGPLVGRLRYVIPPTLPVATTVDGAVVSLVLDPPGHSDLWGVRITRSDMASQDVSVGLLHFLVVTLSGAYTVPLFRPTFPSTKPRFTAG